MSELVVLTRALGAGRLAAAAMAGQLPAGWSPATPVDAAGWRANALALRSEFASSDWLTPLLPAFAASGPAAARLARSGGGAGIVVSTGQQPCLFGGPMYTWSKAISAIAFANALERIAGVPVAPVFWAATYDADLAEAALAFVAYDGEVLRLEMPLTGDGRRRLADTPLGDVSAQFAVLERAAGSAVDRRVLESVRAAYGPKATVGGAFVRLLRDVLEPLGMAVLDAGHPAVMTAGRPVLEAALAKATGIDAALLARDQALRSAGYRPKVAHVKGLSLVFAVKDGERRRIPIADAAEGRKNALEPNVLLRPVMERAILPSAAYHAGPGELAYMAQASAVAEAIGRPCVVSVPRWAGMIVEPHVDRILQRYGLTVDDLKDPHAADTRLARRQMPDAVEAALAHYRAALESASGALAQAVARERAPLVPDAVLEGARRSIAHRLQRLERRLVAAVKHRERELMHDLAVARSSLFPLGRPQERVLDFMPVLARHGTPLIDAMRAAADEHAAALLYERPAAVAAP